MRTQSTNSRQSAKSSLLHIAISGLLVFCCCIEYVSTACSVATSSSTSKQASDLSSRSVQQSALQLARRAITEFLQTGKKIKAPNNLPVALRRRAAVFVTVEKRGQVTPRGCRGTLTPTYSSLADEIINNSIAAATRDNSEPPLRRDELEQCLISLTVVRRIETLQSIAQHDAENNGLIVQRGKRVGIVLPYEGRDAATQLLWAKRKAGLTDNATVQMREMYAVRFRESVSQTRNAAARRN